MKLFFEGWLKSFRGVGFGLLCLSASSCAFEAGAAGESEVCEHITESNLAVVEASSAVESAPSVAAAHEAYQVKLEMNEDGLYVGMVTFTPDEDAEFVIATHPEVGVVIEEMEIRAEPLTSCDVDVALYHFEFHAEPHILTFGPTPHPEFTLLLEEEHLEETDGTDDGHGHAH